MVSVSGNKQSGAVSLFVVIFAMLLITIITVSFLRLMIGDLRQATNNDLSQSAYDSAMAGTEDAKRVLIQYQQYCLSNPGDCARYARDVISNTECNYALINSGVIGAANLGADSGGRTGEIKVQQTTGDGDTFDQAYTCVTINLNTLNVEGSLENGASKIIPLRSETPYNQVQISWYSRDDLSTPSATIDRPAETTPLPLTIQAATPAGWPTTRPPVMRTQFMQYGDQFTQSNFDMTDSGSSNANTVFMYPTRASSTTNDLIDRDTRRSTTTANPSPDSPNSSPLATACVDSVSSGNYACTMTLNIPDPIGSDAASRNAYLRLTPFYKSTHFEVRLFMSGTPVRFEGVQPLIDSTGRANDLFRRVQSRVELADPTFPYPDAAVDVTTNFCKDFAVTDTAPIVTTPRCSYN